MPLSLFASLNNLQGEVSLAELDVLHMEVTKTHMADALNANINLGPVLKLIVGAQDRYLNQRIEEIKDDRVQLEVTSVSVSFNEGDNHGLCPKD